MKPIFSRYFWIIGLSLLGLAGCRRQMEPTQPTQTPVPLPSPSPTPDPGVPGDTGIGDPYYPDLGNGGYDAQFYTLVLDIDPGANRLVATATIEAVATVRLQSFNLDFQGLTVDSVDVNGEAAAFTLAGKELVVRPVAPLPEGEGFVVAVDYHGNPEPMEGIGGLGVPAGWHHAADGTINTINEPDGASTWFPVNDHPRDKAAYRFEVTVPKPWVVAATGDLIETVEVEDKTRFIWQMDEPMASYLAAIFVDQYEIVTQEGPDGILIRNYFTPEYPESYRKNFDQLPEMLSFFSELFGPYPFHAYGVVIADETLWGCDLFSGADETQSLTVNCPDLITSSIPFTVHELAHQWGGNSVSLANWQNVWLKEGFATYAEWLWLTRERGAYELDKMAARFLREIRSSGLAYPIGRPAPDDLFNEGSYSGGAVALHALRAQVGDEAFFEILRTFLARYRGSHASTGDFLMLAEEISGQDLQVYSETWLNSTELPKNFEG